MAESVYPWLEPLTERDREAVLRAAAEAPPLTADQIAILRANGCPIGRTERGAA